MGEKDLVCLHCGNKLPDGALLCPNCSSAVAHYTPVLISQPKSGPESIKGVSSTEAIPKTPLPQLDRRLTSSVSSKSSPRFPMRDPTWPLNTFVSGRYRLVRFIGRGGMGEVYEAEDLELNEHVALKFLRPDLGQDSRALRRFHREIRLARKVTHPNVCRVYDVGHCFVEQPNLAPVEVLYLSMMLLEGETLADRLLRAGSFPAEQALPLIKQMVAALAAAHEAGVIHRDFKSANVMLVGGLQGERAVVTDFGLAHSIAGEGAEQTLSATGLIIGTPAYMSPEQVEGKDVTPSSDIYSLGVVMFEILTGKRPFEGETPFDMALKRLNSPPIPPSAYVPDMDPRWEDVILRCLERDPARRFTQIDEVTQALVGRRSARESLRERVPRLRVPLGIGLLAAVLVAGAWLLWPKFFGKNYGEGVAVAVLGRPTIAMAGFANLAHDPKHDWLSTALVETLGAELAAGEKFRRVSGEEMARVKGDLQMTEGKNLAPDMLMRVRAITGADFVVGGRYSAQAYATESPLQLEVMVQETVTGQTVASYSGKGSVAKLLDLIAQAGSQLRDRLGSEQTVPDIAETVRASFGTSTEVARLYAEGLARMRVYDVVEARNLLEKAVELAPDFPLARSALAETYAQMGHVRKAQQEAEKAYQLSSRLGREQRLLVEARYREFSREWQKAIDLYRSLWTFFPDNLDYGQRLADTLISAAKPQDALVTVKALREQLPEPLRDSPRVDLIEARAYFYASDFVKQQSLAERAEVKSRELGARMLLARALTFKATALRMLHQLDQATTALDEALAILSALGNRRDEAVIANSMAGILYEKQDLAGAARAYREAVDSSRRIGDDTNLAPYLHNLAQVLWELGETKEAGNLIEESVALCRVTKNNKELPAALIRRAIQAIDRGELDLAKTATVEGLDGATAQDRREQQAEALDIAAQLALIEGYFTQARADFDRSIQSYGQIRGREVQQLWGKTHLAEVALEQGQVKEAEVLARQASNELAKVAKGDSQIENLVVLAKVLVADEKILEARATVDQAIALAQKSPGPRLRLQVAIANGEVAAAQGQTAFAQALLREALMTAEQGGFVPLALNARLALAKIELRWGDANTGRRNLQELEKEANAKGFLLIAKKAKSAQGG